MLPLVRLEEAEELYKEEHDTAKCRMLHLGKKDSMHLSALGKEVCVCVCDVYVCVSGGFLHDSCSNE